jgi:hypothetical protein
MIVGGGGPPVANFVGGAGGGEVSAAVRSVRGEGEEGSARELEEAGRSGALLWA